MVKYQPLTFSSFSRLVAHIASISMTKQQKHDSKSNKKEAPPKSAGSLTKALFLSITYDLIHASYIRQLFLEDYTDQLSPTL